MHGAERFASVAAASFLARAAFLDRLKELSEEVAVDLPKGAGPQVERAARRFLAIHGSEKLGLVAKLHFKTTERIVGRRK
jgi:ribonuclease HIII